MTTARRRRGDLIGVALRLGRLLESEDYVLVGGLAVGVHGFVRTSNGLEFMSRGPLARARKRLREAGVETRMRRSEVPEDGFTRVRGELDGVPFDILPPLVPVVREAVIEVDIRGGTLRVVDLDKLLWLKFRVGSPVDLLDAARLVMLHPETEARARELATAYRLLDRLEAWLRDSRIRAQAAEEAERERRRTKKAPRRRVKPSA
jgi:hypothetical protein